MAQGASLVASGRVLQGEGLRPSSHSLSSRSTFAPTPFTGKGVRTVLKERVPFAKPPSPRAAALKPSPGASNRIRPAQAAFQLNSPTGTQRIPPPTPGHLDRPVRKMVVPPSALSSSRDRARNGQQAGGAKQPMLSPLKRMFRRSKGPTSIPRGVSTGTTRINRGGPTARALSGSAAGTTKVNRGAQRVAKGLYQAASARLREGILGTSGTFGFTKANELFVGRVAMLGFAASLLGEAVTGQGILAQLNMETGIPVSRAPPLLLALVVFVLLGAVGGLGSQGWWEADPQQPLKAGDARTALGLASRGPLFGFTKQNEVFVGRIAQLGIAASLLGELLTGKGALAQLNIETGIPIWQLQPLVLFFIAFMLVAAVNPGEGRFVKDEDVD